MLYEVITVSPKEDAPGEKSHEPPIDESDFFADTAQGDEAGHGTPIDTGEEIRPEGLYSPVTGIGWEQYLGERLDAELVRAASSEQDLALIIVRISGLLHTDLLARKVAVITSYSIHYTKLYEARAYRVQHRS